MPREFRPKLEDVIDLWLQNTITVSNNIGSLKQEIDEIVSNMRAQNKSEDYIYEYIGNAYHQYGNPYDWWTEIFLGGSLERVKGNRHCVDHEARISWDQAVKMMKDALKKMRDAEKEFQNKRRCIQLQLET